MRSRPTSTKPKRSLHHRHPRSKADSYSGDIDERRNVKRVNDKAHAHFHALFQNMLPEQIAQELNRRWISPDYVLICIKAEDYYATVRELTPTQSEVSHLQLVSSTHSHG
jgi:sarcosine oxidase gamma subunit